MISIPTRRTVTDSIPSNSAAGVSAIEVCTRQWAQPTSYELRLFARISAGTAEALTVAHNFYIDDGLGDGARLVTLSNTLATGLVSEAYQIVTGIALDLCVRVESIPSGAVANAHGCLVSAVPAERL